MTTTKTILEKAGRVLQSKARLRSKSVLLPKEKRNNPKEVAKAIFEIVEINDGRWYQGDWGHFSYPDRTDFDGYQPQIYNEPATDEACGTACCVAGWATLLATPKTSLVHVRRESNPHNWYTEFHLGKIPIQASVEGQKALGLNTPDAEWLFDGDRERHQVLEALNVIMGTDWNQKLVSLEDEVYAFTNQEYTYW